MSGIAPKEGPLDERTAAHLLRRTAFGADPTRIAEWVGRSAADVVRGLLDEARNAPLPVPFAWANSAPPPRGSAQADIDAYNRNNVIWIGEARWAWLSEMRKTGLRERLALFWHNHFVTESPGYIYAVYSTRYLGLLRTHALGNFRSLTREIGLTPAMLRYLDGALNRSGAPNENYARELLELFTMSPTGPDSSPNYTEADIRELSRALTGWQVDSQAMTAVFAANRHDAGVKSVFGRSGAFGYDAVLDVIFEERGPQIADHVCRRLYSHFVYHEPEPAFCAELAAGLLADGFLLEPTIERLLTSERFFDPDLMGGSIKSPVELALGLMEPLGVPPSDDLYRSLDRSCRSLSQTLLDPPSVAGWPGHRDWLTTSLLPLRWTFTDGLFTGTFGRSLDLVSLVTSIHDPNDPEAAFHLPVKLTALFLAVPAASLDLAAIEAPFAGNLVQHPVPDWVLNGPEHVPTLAKMFLGGLPWYEWSPVQEGAHTLVAGFLQQIAHLPEFQLV